MRDPCIACHLREVCDSDDCGRKHFPIYENRKSMKRNTAPLPFSAWCAEDKPSYKMEQKGVRSLTTTELLSILIGAGTDKYNALEIAKLLMADNDNSLKKISGQPLSELQKTAGVGEANGRRVLAALELGRRMMEQSGEESPCITSATMIYNIMRPTIGNLDTEEFWVLLINQAGKLIKKVKISHGGLTEVTVDVRVIMKHAILNNATIIGVCHNHPSGSTVPSKHDDKITETIRKACDTMRIHLLDHVIVTDGDYYSYAENGRI